MGVDQVKGEIFAREANPRTNMRVGKTEWSCCVRGQVLQSGARTPGAVKKGVCEEAGGGKKEGKVGNGAQEKRKDDTEAG